MTTNLEGFKKHAWKKDLSGAFTVNGKELTDKQVRIMIDWAISKGYKRDADIPEDKVVELLKLNEK